MKVTASQYAEIRDRCNAWVTIQLGKGMPHTGGGRSGAEVQIDTGKAIEWEVAQAKAAGRTATQNMKERLTAKLKVYDRDLKRQYAECRNHHRVFNH